MREEREWPVVNHGSWVGGWAKRHKPGPPGGLEGARGRRTLKLTGASLSV